MRKELTKSYYFGGAYRGQGLVLTVIGVGWSYLTVMTIAL